MRVLGDLRGDIQVLLQDYQERKLDTVSASEVHGENESNAQHVHPSAGLVDDSLRPPNVSTRVESKDVLVGAVSPSGDWMVTARTDCSDGMHMGHVPSLTNFNKF